MIPDIINFCYCIYQVLKLEFVKLWGQESISNWENFDSLLFFSVNAFPF